MSAELAQLCRRVDECGQLLVLTGAGISAESGIPTFRGAEGFWTVGSRNYRPQQLATRRMFGSQPELVWAFYLDRIVMANQAQPNRGHLALAELARLWRTRMGLVTQNVDNLHRRAGHDESRLWEIHGNLRWLRCFAACHDELWECDWSEITRLHTPGNPLAAPLRSLVQCARCGGWARPHVLWFDEYYDEMYYHAETAMRAAEQADTLLIVGTTGATNLPHAIARHVAQQGGCVWEINPESTQLTTYARESGGGFIPSTAATALDQLVAAWRTG